MNAHRSTPRGKATVDRVEEHTIICPNCGAARSGPAVPVRAAGATMVWVCHTCEQAFEIGHWFAPVAREKPMTIERLRQENDQLRADAKRLQEWVTDMQQGFYVNCVYCGHRYGPAKDTPVAMHEMLTTHIENCTQHPLFHARSEIAALQTPTLFLVPENLHSFTGVRSLDAAVELAAKRDTAFVAPVRELPKHLLSPPAAGKSK